MRFLLFAFLCLSMAIGGHCQSAEPRVWIKNVPSYNTSRDEILANPVLITDSPGCVVSGFTLSLQAKGQDFFGPLYAVGADFTDVQKAQIKKYVYPDVTVYIQDIHLNCNGQDTRSSALEYKYNN
jgi:hypothetical protein